MSRNYEEELMSIVLENDNQEESIIKAIEIITLFLEQHESSQ